MKHSWLVLQDAAASMLLRPGKIVLTAFGAMMGVASIVALVGLTTSATAHIVKQFDAAAATLVTVEAPPRRTDNDTAPLGWNSERALLALNGVEVTASTAEVARGVVISKLSAVDATEADSAPAHVVASTAGFIEALGLRLTRGRSFDEGHAARADPVALIGSTAAIRLGIRDVQRSRVVFLNSRPFRVLGVFDAVGDTSEYLNAIVVPSGVGASDYGLRAPEQIHIRTSPGAARTIARQAPIAVGSASAGRLVASYAAEPTALREQVSADTRALLIVVGMIGVLGGAVSIANTMLVSVLERTHEIGVRRAVGARRRDVLAQFMAESAVLGFTGGMAGSSIGAIVIVAASSIQGWAPTADWWLFPAGVVLGTATGLLAGVLPAWRAARVEPATSLRAV